MLDQHTAKQWPPLALLPRVWHRFLVAAWGMMFALPSLAGLEVYTTFEKLDGWLIERQTSVDGEHRCRAFIPSGGAWFSANIHLDRNDQLVVPQGLHADVEQDVISAVRLALKRCRANVFLLEDQ